jgi:hypothetical protein
VIASGTGLFSVGKGGFQEMDALAVVRGSLRRVVAERVERRIS